MQRTEAVIRGTKWDGLRAYDIFHVWPDGHVKDGVKWTSNLFVYLAEERPAVRVRLWAPGRPPGEARKLAWGEEWWVPSGGFGIVSAVADGDVPLHVFWELSAGKA